MDTGSNLKKIQKTSDKKIVFFDLDGTLCKGLSQSYLVHHLFSKRKVTTGFLIIISIWAFLYQYGIFKNPERIIKFACRITKGWLVADLTRFIENFFNQRLVQMLYPELITILNKYQEEHHVTVLITNAVRPLAEVIGCRLDFDFVIATELEIVDGIYTGLVSGDVIYGTAKAKAVRKFVQNQEYSCELLAAYSDHISDLPLLEMVQNPVAVNPDPMLRKIARDRKWNVLDCNKKIPSKK